MAEEARADVSEACDAGHMLEDLRATLSPKRFEHSLRVADLGVSIAGALAIDAGAVYVAALMHDCAREWSKQKLRRYLKPRDPSIYREFRDNPVLLHGAAAYYVLKEEYRVRSADILDAVLHHTLGHPSIGPIGRVIFAADYLEPGRKSVDEAFRSQLLGKCLRCMDLGVMEHARLRGYEPHHLTLEFAAVLRDEPCCCDPGDPSRGKARNERAST